MSCRSLKKGIPTLRTDLITSILQLLNHHVLERGDKMDDAIIAYIQRKHNVLIGELNAERVKKVIGSASPPERGDGRLMAIKDRNPIRQRCF